MSCKTSASTLSLECAALGYPGAPPALERVQLRLNAGERVALLGGNGAGKTALLQTLVGLLPPVNGRVQIDGRDVTGQPTRAVQAGAGLVFQNPDDQLFGTTVWEDALCGPQNQGHSPTASAHRVEHALRQLHMLELRDRPIEALSFGEKKRACLAGVLAMQPSLLLLDEPSAGLDPLGELAFLELIASSSGPGRATLLLATHAVDLVPLFADRVILLAERSIVADGPPREVFRQSALLCSAHVRAPWAAELWLRLNERLPAALACNPEMPLTLAEAAARFTLRQP
ncbi:MAG: ABC transporter ATP-binding protein [Deltaproteobacteria bacterium]